MASGRHPEGESWNARRTARATVSFHAAYRHVFQIRIEPALRDRLARLRDERHVNVSAWARDVIAAALDREFPADLEAPKRQPLAGWRPCKLDDGWGAVLDGPDVAALAEDPRGTPISIIDSRGGSWTATITEVVSRNQRRIVVRDSGRP